MVPGKFDQDKVQTQLKYTGVLETTRIRRQVRHLLGIERFPIECRKTKTKVITLANHNRCKQHNEPIRIPSKYM